MASRLPSENTEIKIHIALTLFVVSYGYDAWFGVLSLDHRQRVFKNVELRRMSGRKEEEVKGG